MNFPFDGIIEKWEQKKRLKGEKQQGAWRKNSTRVIDRGNKQKEARKQIRGTKGKWPQDNC